MNIVAFLWLSNKKHKAWQNCPVWVTPISRRNRRIRLKQKKKRKNKNINCEPTWRALPSGASENKINIGRTVCESVVRSNLVYKRLLSVSDIDRLSRIEFLCWMFPYLPLRFFIISVGSTFQYLYLMVRDYE